MSQREPVLYFRAPYKLDFGLWIHADGTASEPNPVVYFNGELISSKVNRDERGVSFRYEKDGWLTEMYVHKDGITEVKVTKSDVETDAADVIGDLG